MATDDVDFEVDEYEEEAAQLDENDRWATPLWRWSSKLGAGKLSHPVELDLLLVAPLVCVKPLLPGTAEVSAVSFLPRSALVRRINIKWR
jgi:hypothetical protein